MKDPFAYLSMLVDKVIAPAPLEDKIARDLVTVQTEIYDYDYTIRLQTFAKHMALAKQAAMLSWIEMEKQRNDV